MQYFNSHFWSSKKAPKKTAKISYKKTSSFFELWKPVCRWVTSTTPRKHVRWERIFFCWPTAFKKLRPGWSLQNWCSWRRRFARHQKVPSYCLVFTCRVFDCLFLLLWSAVFPSKVVGLCCVFVVLWFFLTQEIRVGGCSSFTWTRSPPTMQTGFILVNEDTDWLPKNGMFTRKNRMSLSMFSFYRGYTAWVGRWTSKYSCVT